MSGNKTIGEILAALTYGKIFIVYLDHKPLKNINIKARIDKELGDLTYYLSQYNFKPNITQEN